MKIPRKILSIVALSSLVLCPFVLRAEAAPPERPNIVWITSEDNSHHWVGCYGVDANARTPNIDALAARGVRYEHFYANAPVCAVARCMILTGMYSSSLGTQNMRSRYPIPASIRPYVSYLREAGYYCSNQSKTDYNFAGKDPSWWDASGRKAHYRNRPGGQPFFAIFNFTASHESSLFPSKTASYRKGGHIPATPRVAPDTIKLPPHLPDLPELREDWATYHDIMEYMDRQVGAALRELEKEGVADNTIVFYYADHGGILPRAKRFLYDTGTHVPLVIHFPEKWKHLSPTQAGGTVAAPAGFIDLAPTLLSLASVPVPPHMQGRAFLGAQAREADSPYTYLFAQRFDEMILNFRRGVTDGHWRYIRNFHPHRPLFSTHGYMHGQQGWAAYHQAWKDGKVNALQARYWEAPLPTEELYHTDLDPWEIKNLAHDPAHTERLQRMRAACLNKMKSIRDTGILPEALYPDVTDSRPVYETVQAEAFPYQEILDLALAASDATPATLPRLQAALSHEHPAMRYWAALGCTLLGEAAHPAGVALEKLLRDPSAGVRTLAARALIAQGAGDRAIPALLDIIDQPDAADIPLLEAFDQLERVAAIDRISSASLNRIAKTKGYAARLANYHRKQRQ